MYKLVSLALLISSLSSAAVIELQTLSAFQAGGHYVGMVGSNFGPVICLDFDRVSYVPSSFEVTVHTPTTQVERLQAYLAASLLGFFPPSLLTDEFVGSYQFAIWNAKNDSFPDYGYSQILLDGAVAANVQNLDFSFLTIYRPVNSPNQAFIGFSIPGSTHTPEPLSFALVGFGLVFLGLRSRRLI